MYIDMSSKTICKTMHRFVLNSSLKDPVRFGTSRVQWQSHGSWSSMIGQWNMQSAVSWTRVAQRASKSLFFWKRNWQEKKLLEVTMRSAELWSVWWKKRRKPWLHHINSQFKSASAVIRWSQQDVAALPAWPVCPALSAATVLVELK